MFMGKVFLKSLYSIVVILSIINLFTSCSDDSDDAQSMVGTVWIHQFKPEDHIVDGAAGAFYFGKDKVEEYALDENLKVLRLIQTLNYKVKGQTIVIGIKEGTLTDNTLHFDGYIYYRSNKSITDILTP